MITSKSLNGTISSLTKRKLELYGLEQRLPNLSRMGGSTQGLRKEIHHLKSVIPAYETTPINQTVPLKLGHMKLGRSIELISLIKAKKHSDEKDYGRKNEILQKLLQHKPHDFMIDSALPGGYVGLTHKPTGFRIHAPRGVIPTGVNLQE